MRRWPYKAVVFEMKEILAAVDDTEWQSFRLSLKGISTEDKLSRLHERLQRHMKDGKVIRVEKVRIDNYLYALRRGGQLDENFCVRK